MHCIDNMYQKSHVLARHGRLVTGSLVGGTCDADAETWRVGSSAGEGDSETKVKTEKSKRRAAGPGGVRSTTYCIHV